MILAISLGFCVLVACLLFGSKKKVSLDHGDMQRINRRFDKLHPDDRA